MLFMEVFNYSISLVPRPITDVEKQLGIDSQNNQRISRIYYYISHAPNFKVLQSALFSIVSTAPPFR